MSDSNVLNKALTDTVLTRRSFLKWSAALGGTAALAGGVGYGLKAAENAAAAAEGEWKPAACWHNCGGRCPVTAYVVDDVVLRVKTDDSHPDTTDYPQQRACLRGRAQRNQVFSADRLKYPMVRKNWAPGGGDKSLRGKDDWVRLSWDEALNLVATELKRIKDTYGNESIYCTGGGEIQRTLSLFGGYVSNYGSTSRGAWRLGQKPITGTTAQSEMNDRFDLQNSRLIVMWGNNPAWSSMGLASYNFLQAKKAGAKFIFVDPFYNPTAAILADEWIPIRPVTDTTMLLAMAHVMLTEDDPTTNPLIDWDFLNRCTVGFDAEHMPEGADPKENFKDYVLGVHDGQPKSPDWAAPICGVPAEKIRSFALEVARTKPTAMLFGWNAARTEKAQHVCLATISIGAMTGNMGIPGGSCGISCHSSASNGGPALVRFGSPGMTSIPNPRSDLRLCSSEHWDAILSGKYTDGVGPKKDINIKAIYHGGGSRLNQTNNINKGIAAHRIVDFVVTQQYGLNANAQYSDVVFPITTPWERYANFQTGNRELVVWAGQVVQPLFETKDDLWVAVELAKRLGLDAAQVADISQEQQAFNRVAGATVRKMDGSDMEPLVTITAADIAEWGVTGEPQAGRISLAEFRTRGFYAVPRFKGDKLGYIHNRKFREDPVANPLDTASGKLNLHCQELADMVTAAGWNQGYPIAIYDPPAHGYEATFSDWNNQVKGPYPLQMCNIHYPRRTHSVFDNVQWLREAWPQELMMNTLDAEARGLKTGDTVRVYNQFGSVLRPVLVTPRARPGVVFLGEGAWPEFDEFGNDMAGATNTISADVASGPDIESWQACVVEVEKWHGKPLAPDAAWPQRVIFQEA